MLEKKTVLYGIQTISVNCFYNYITVKLENSYSPGQVNENCKKTLKVSLKFKYKWVDFFYIIFSKTLPNILAVDFNDFQYVVGNKAILIFRFRPPCIKII